MADLGLFNTCFKRRFGASPGQWRKTAARVGRHPAGSSRNFSRRDEGHERFEESRAAIADEEQDSPSAIESKKFLLNLKGPGGTAKQDLVLRLHFNSRSKGQSGTFR